jgi:hypothetical protein
MNKSFSFRNKIRTVEKWLGGGNTDDRQQLILFGKRRLRRPLIAAGARENSLLGRPPETTSFPSLPCRSLLITSLFVPPVSAAHDQREAPLTQAHENAKALQRPVDNCPWRK